MQFELGQTVPLKTEEGVEPYLVVRIVSNSSTLFEKEDGTRYILTESYVELRNEQNKVRFVSLEEQKIPSPSRKTGEKIKALTTYTWKMEG